MMTVLQAYDIHLSYNKKKILDNISLCIEEKKITSIIGPNGSGKSTLLKALSKSLTPSSGTVCFNGKDLNNISTKELARHLAVLCQMPEAPQGVAVKDLVTFGRFPHQSWWKDTSKEDNSVVDWAIKQTGLKELEHRPIHTLSGGERQRAWISMALAQQPKTLILDEPTTYLDIAHQLEILELIKRLNKDAALSVIMVLHDLNHAAKYSDYIVVLHQGKIVADGNPAEVITTDMLRTVFEVEADLWHDHENKPFFVARGLIEKT